MSGTASNRIVELYQLLKSAGGREEELRIIGGSDQHERHAQVLAQHEIELQVLAIKQYLDELADGRPVPHPVGTDAPTKE